MKKISIITVVRNCQSTIERCISSVLSQDYSCIELIIVDGGSTDGTKEILDSYQRCFAHYISEPDHGLYDAMNKGLRLSTGDYVRFLNADDYLPSSTLISECARYIGIHDVVYHGLMRYEEAGQIVTKGGPFEYRRELLSSTVPQIALLIPRALCVKVGDFDTRYNIAADYDYILRLAAVAEFRFIPVVCGTMVAGGISYKSPISGFVESYQIARKRGSSGLFATIAFMYKVVRFYSSRLI